MKITKQELLDGLATLDPTSDADWTEEGLPALERIQAATLDDTITRQDLNEHANGITREVLAETDKELDAEAAAPRMEVVEEAPAEATAEVPHHSDLEQAYLDAKQAVEDHDAMVAKFKQERDRLVAEHDRALRERDALYPPVKPAEAIQSWLASEAEKRANRAGQVYHVPAPLSPLDASMQRRTGHGGGRKVVPPMPAMAG